MIRRLVLALLCALALGGRRARGRAGRDFEGPGRLEARARMVSAELRCLVCQNESIDESHAPLAHDIRMLVRQRLEAGDTNQQGRRLSRVALRPVHPAQAAVRAADIAPLGHDPLLVILAGGIAIAFAARRRPARDPARPLSEGEQRKLDELLGPSA